MNSLIQDAQDAPPKTHQGWSITITHGQGPYGSETVVAAAQKKDTMISAVAWSESTAWHSLANRKSPDQLVRARYETAATFPSEIWI